VRERIASYANLVKVSHSVFAMPFALMMLVVVSKSNPVSWAQVTFLILCVVFARTSAMAFNRLVDAGIDARNPRTASREIPQGVVSTCEGAVITLVSAGAFIAASYALGAHCGMLAPVVLVVLLGYSLLKRYTVACHFVLGLALACAPGGVWYAVTATWAWEPVVLMVAVLLWVVGFDILYACQDLEFDRANKLKSIPVWLGATRTRKLSVVLHIMSVACLGWFGSLFGLGSWYWVGVSLFGIFIASQHTVVHRQGFSSIDQVFLTRNGVASVVLFVFVALDVFLGKA
jgi:4-hydroxybenzoate polyprenyltransferase